MKRYKLLKDLPTFSKGDTFQLDEDSGCLVREKDGVVAYAPYTLEKFNILESDWFEEIPEEYKRWRAELHEAYYIIHDDGVVFVRVEDNRDVDNDRCSIGNYFKTREEAQKASDWLKAFTTLRDDTKGFKPNWEDCDQEKWSVVYDHENDTMSPVTYYTSQKSVLFFANKDDAVESIEAHEHQWLTFFNCGVEE